jgi:hypothetical protein
MADVTTLQSRDAQLTAGIGDAVDRIRTATPIVLPGQGADIVQFYAQKIQGTYNVERAKRDTDNAIDLLYIAYNTTPQIEGDVRNKITAVMNKVITAQQTSERTVRGGMRVAKSIVEQIDDLFPDWVDTKEGGGEAEIKAFLGKDLVDLATGIKAKALKVRDELLTVASSYDEIINDTVEATSISEKALSGHLVRKAEIEREIAESNAKREQLESLVNDLKDEVAKFDKMARDYEARAATAEQRAFVMSIVKVGAQMISQAVPAIAMAAGGPAPMLATSALSVLSAPASPTAPGQASSKEVADSAASGAKAAEQAKSQSKISEHQAEIKKVEERAATIKEEIKTLTAEKDKLTQKGDGPPAKDASSAQAVQAAEYEKRIKIKADELKAQEEERARLQDAIKSLQASFGALEKGAAKMSDEQQQQATSLREMQMRMLDKVETYERERRTQSAELVKITALLKGVRKRDEDAELAIRSLNLSLSGLKRMKEIIVEIAFFFKSFADFMDEVALEASDQLDRIGAVVGMETIRKNRLAQVVRSVDEFFIRQTAEWRAVSLVSDRFVQAFSEGWSKLNKLSGEYITGDRLKGYLETASIQLAAIAAEREAAADQKIASLDSYRKQMQESA